MSEEPDTDDLDGMFTRKTRDRAYWGLQGSMEEADWHAVLLRGGSSQEVEADLEAVLRLRSRLSDGFSIGDPGGSIDTALVRLGKQLEELLDHALRVEGHLLKQGKEYDPATGQLVHTREGGASGRPSHVHYDVIRAEYDKMMDGGWFDRPGGGAWPTNTQRDRDELRKRLAHVLQPEFLGTGVPGPIDNAISPHVRRLRSAKNRSQR